MLAPVFYAILSSLKGKSEFYQTAWWTLPAEPLLTNYLTAIEKIHFFELTTNSLVVSTGTVAGVLVLSWLAAFALACFLNSQDVVAQTAQFLDCRQGEILIGIQACHCVQDDSLAAICWSISVLCFR